MNFGDGARGLVWVVVLDVQGGVLIEKPFCDGFGLEFGLRARLYGSGFDFGALLKCGWVLLLVVDVQLEVIVHVI